MLLRTLRMKPINKKKTFSLLSQMFEMVLSQAIKINTFPKNTLSRQNCLTLKGFVTYMHVFFIKIIYGGFLSRFFSKG